MLPQTKSEISWFCADKITRIFINPSWAWARVVICSAIRISFLLDRVTISQRRWNHFSFFISRNCSSEAVESRVIACLTSSRILSFLLAPEVSNINSQVAIFIPPFSNSNSSKPRCTSTDSFWADLILVSVFLALAVICFIACCKVTVMPYT